MGICGWTINGSDDAADVVYNFEDHIIEFFRNQLEDPGNEYNTSGVENVAMIFDEIIIPSPYWQEYGDELKKFAKEVLELLESIEKDDDDEDDDDNKEYLRFHKKICSRLKKFSNSLEE
jgi:hypothetical protein